MQDYYAKHSSNFTSNSAVVKARVIKISQNSPNIASIKNLYKENGIEEVDELERLCYNSADKYDNFGNNWVDISSVASIYLMISSHVKEPPTAVLHRDRRQPL